MGRVLALVERERVVMLTLVGDASARPLLAELDNGASRYDTSSLQLLGSGGAILSADVKARLLTMLPSVRGDNGGDRIVGVSVQAVAVARLRLAPPASRCGSTLCSYTTMVVDDELRPIAAGSGGAIRPVGDAGPAFPRFTTATSRRARYVCRDRRRPVGALPGDMASVDADGSIRPSARAWLDVHQHRR